MDEEHSDFESKAAAFCAKARHLVNLLRGNPNSPAAPAAREQLAGFRTGLDQCIAAYERFLPDPIAQSRIDVMVLLKADLDEVTGSNRVQ